MWHPILTITLFTFREAVRSRLFALLAVIAVIGFGLAEFLGSIAITEVRAIQAGVLSAVLRITAVFVLAVFVIASLSREASEKGTDFLFSLPFTRATYYFGKLGGYALVAACIALTCWLVLMRYSPPTAVLIWSISLFCELLLIIAISLLLVFSFSHVLTALSGLMGIYLLARSINTFLLMAHGPFFDSSSLVDQATAWILEAIAYLMPALDLFAKSDWLIYPPGVAVLGPVLIQTSIYSIMISGAAMYDLYRKSL